MPFFLQCPSLRFLTLKLGRLLPFRRPQVEDFEMDIDVDTEKLEIFGTIITEVKMEGRVPASSHLIYDCSHGEWLLAQMAHDRKIRLFSSRCGCPYPRTTMFFTEKSCLT